MTDATPSSANQAPATIATDLPCVDCGYNLRTQPRDGRCPECATPVLHSLRAGSFDFVTPAWRARATRGLLWITCGAVGGAALHSVTWFHGQPMAGGGVSQLGLFLFFELLPLLALAAAALGCFWGSTPEQRRPKPGPTPRRVLRIAASVMLLGLGLSIAVVVPWRLIDLSLYGPGVTSGALRSLATVVYLLTSGVALYVAQAALWRLLASWFARIDEPLWAKVARYAFWIHLITGPMRLITDSGIWFGWNVLPQLNGEPNSAVVLAMAIVGSTIDVANAAVRLAIPVFAFTMAVLLRRHARTATPPQAPAAAPSPPAMPAPPSEPRP